MIPAHNEQLQAAHRAGAQQVMAGLQREREIGEAQRAGAERGYGEGAQDGATHAANQILAGLQQPEQGQQQQPAPEQIAQMIDAAQNGDKQAEQMLQQMDPEMVGQIAQQMQGGQQQDPANASVEQIAQHMAEDPAVIADALSNSDHPKAQEALQMLSQMEGGQEMIAQVAQQMQGQEGPAGLS